MTAGDRREQLCSGDLITLVSDVGPVPMNVGALLFVAGDGDVDAATVEATFTRRLTSIRRLQQRLATPRRGLGRPYWVDDSDFDVRAHVARVRCPSPGGHDAALAIAVDAVTRPLPRSRPLWRAVVVTGLIDDHTGLVLVLHHVVADGIGGLAVLARLVDGADPAGPADDTAAPPRGRLVDRISERFRTLRRLPHRVARIRGGWAELGRGRGGWAPRCSLNAATGPRRRVVTVDVGLNGVRAAGRRSGATVNDVLLVAVTGALAELLRERMEFPQELVVSVPVSARSSATSGHLGNQVGVMPVRVPLVGSFQERLTTVSGVTRVQKMRTRGTSSALIGPLFRILAALRLFRWFVDRQRLVNSFLTNLPGPPGQLVIAGAPITGITPITVTAGNVGVAFAALSYAGTLTVTIIVDPDVVPEVRELAAALHEQFRAAIE
ncbi:wax ester/triacylglycerol synthase domain-containing protein [Rhodococcus sp. IEGM 1305]|uniref:wax ester/triacylglycerol synthase domain-containing protein n=1 Tax=Rhodococcus sp. IEGM 1305 TaxID=3047092 RepID=UPI0024B848DA|nr:wax ester/triacylglycerol synthase domain-containing protein [Rhodococcus sp. IEGM 1305]MDI9952215.1 wax ester/triacylglycerol synthase family O-acyltransferase [Rhodococcus sp. IEGM 1305]